MDPIEGSPLTALMTLRDVQTQLQIGRTKIYELIRDGDLPVVRIGRALRIRRESLERWIAQQEENVERRSR